MEGFVALGMAVLTILASVATLAWWLSHQFQEVKDSFGAKLAAHEKEDTERFQRTELHLQRLDMSLHECRPG